MILKKFVVGPLETNAYIFGDGDTKEVVVIDPGGDPIVIDNFIKKNKLTLRYIINTHGHSDHIGANSYFGTAALIHKLDRVSVPEAASFLEHGDKIKIGNLNLEVIHTPGHTPGSICLKYDNILFSGDTLFFEGVGRTDLPNGSWDRLILAIKDKLMKLPDGCRVYPGHGPETSIGHERRYNPFL